MGFNCGIVGLPNVGKSTIFNALLKAQKAESANYSFCTVEPNHGVVPVPDRRMNFITQYVVPKTIVPAAMEFVDIAGLVKGASQGKGLGNQFLTHIRQVDAILHVVRCFDDENITHEEGSVDPVRDISIIQTELMIADYEILERAHQRIQKNAKGGDSQMKLKAMIINELLEHLSDSKPVRSYLDNKPDYREHVNEYRLLTDKPILYVANVSEDDILSGNSYVEAVKKIAADEGAKVVTICGKTECDLLELTDEEASQYLNELGLQYSGLESLILAGYDLLGLITYFTAGEKEVRAWTIEKDTTAQKAAGKIHSDIERGFIRAEVVSYDDFTELKSLSLAKEKGKMRLEGKDYIVRDGDIIYFRHNV